MVHLSKCPLCDSEDISNYLKCRDHFLSGEMFELSVCGSCGFIFTQDHPGERDSARYYESDEYASHNIGSTGFFNMIYRLSRKIMLAGKRRLIIRATGMKSGRLLDIGSGSGHFLSGMKNAGWDVTGIEINDKARDISEKLFSLNVISPERTDTLKSGSYDCITLWHVLEHFHDPFHYAVEIKRLLKEEGICIAALPNSASYDARHYSGSWAAYDVPRHLWHFSPETFRLFSAKAGFRLKKIIPLPPDVFYISMLSEKYKGSGIYYLKGILRGIWFSFLSLFRKHRSSSLVYILENRSGSSTDL